MFIDRALYLDQHTKNRVIEDLEKILASLQDFKANNPRVFGTLSEEAIATGDMSLGDAESALNSAIALLGEKDHVPPKWSTGIVIRHDKGKYCCFMEVQKIYPLTDDEGLNNLFRYKTGSVKLTNKYWMESLSAQIDALLEMSKELGIDLWNHRPYSQGAIYWEKDGVGVDAPQNWEEIIQQQCDRLMHSGLKFVNVYKSEGE